MATQPQKPLEIIVLRPALSKEQDLRGVPCCEVVTHRYSGGYLIRCGGRTPKWYATKDIPTIKQFHDKCPGWPDFDSMGKGHMTKSAALAALEL